jgi:4-amino-4-deoxy-L-arabinose transferase-like glycosyltransferase
VREQGRERHPRRRDPAAEEATRRVRSRPDPAATARPASALDHAARCEVAGERGSERALAIASRMTVPSRRASYLPALAILALALVLRLCLFVAVGSWDPERLRRRIFVGDARGYHRLATNLLERGAYSDERAPPYAPNTVRPPLYPGYLVAVYALLGAQPHWAILVQLVVSSLSCVVLYRVGAALFDGRAGLLAGLLAAIDYTSVLFANRLYSDTLFLFFFALVLLGLARFLAAGGRRFVAGAAVALGLATLCRPVSVYLGAAILPVVWLRLRARPRAALTACVVFLGLFVLVLSPWLVRNQRVAGHPYVSSMQADVWGWYLPAILGFVDADGNDVSQRDPFEWGDIGRDARRFGAGAVRFFTVLGSGEVPLLLGMPYERHDYVALREAGFLQWVAATLRNRSSPFERTVVASMLLYLAALYCGAAWGVVRALRQRRLLEAALLLATIAYFVVATGPIAREARYRLPAIPAIVLLAGYGFAGISRRSPAASSRSAARRRRANGTPERSAVSSRVCRPSLWLSTQSSAISSSRPPLWPPSEP